MSLWPIKVRYKELVEREEYFTIDYAEFLAWSGKTIDEATDRELIDFLEAGAEFGCWSYPEEVVSRGVDD